MSDIGYLCIHGIFTTTRLFYSKYGLYYYDNDLCKYCCVHAINCYVHCKACKEYNLCECHECLHEIKCCCCYFS